LVFYTSSKNQTQKISALLAGEILKQKRPFFQNQALILLLSGDLGAGKTTFTQGFMKGAGIKKKITSPTFVIMKKFKIQNPKTQTNSKLKILNYKNIYHIDCYRFHKLDKFFSTSIKEVFHNPQNIVLIEWPERIKRLLPKDVIMIKLKYGKKDNERIITI